MVLVVGVYHKPDGVEESGGVKEAIQFLHSQKLAGKKVAVEVPFDIKLFDQPEREADIIDILGAENAQFWRRIVKEIIDQKGIPVPVDNSHSLRLQQQSQQALTNLKKTREFYSQIRARFVADVWRASFRRITQMVLTAHNGHISILLTGFPHAKEVEHVLGGKANVVYAMPLHILPNYQAHLQEMRAWHDSQNPTEKAMHERALQFALIKKPNRFMEKVRKVASFPKRLFKSRRKKPGR